MKKKSNYYGKHKDTHLIKQVVQKNKEFVGAHESNTHWVQFTSFFRFNHPNLPKDFEVSFIVMLKKPMHKDVVKQKLREAFG